MRRIRPLVEQARILVAVVVNHECNSHGAEIEQMMPIAIAPSHAPCFESWYRAHLAEANRF